MYSETIADTAKKFGKELKVTRIRLNMNQDEFAKIANIPRQHLSEVESGYRILKEPQIAEMMKLFPELMEVV